MYVLFVWSGGYMSCLSGLPFFLPTSYIHVASVLCTCISYVHCDCVHTCTCIDSYHYYFDNILNKQGLWGIPVRVLLHPNNF